MKGDYSIVNIYRNSSRETLRTGMPMKLVKCYRQVKLVKCSWSRGVVFRKQMFFLSVFLDMTFLECLWPPVKQLKLFWFLFVIMVMDLLLLCLLCTEMAAKQT